jgi:acyl-CoA hydrolase
MRTEAGPTVLPTEDLDLARWVRPGDTVIWGQACAEPLTLTETLFAQRHEIGGFRAFLGIPASDTVRLEYADVVRFTSYCGTGVNARLHDAGVLDVLTADYSTFPELFGSRQVPIDVALVQVPPALEDGTYSLGLASEYLSAAVDAARVVIAEVNDQLPSIRGTRRLHPHDLSAIVHTSRPPTEFVAPHGDAVTEAVATQVASLIEDGATLQIGIGSLPQSVLAQLTNHQDLGIHSGMLSDGVVDLVEAGVVTNTCKGWDAGITVGGLLMGTRRLFEWAAGDPTVQLRSTTYTHDLNILGSVERFVAINSAVEIDLLGQINTERLGSTYVGAVGGAVDFARGAARSPGGVAITALPSTGRGQSRIVQRLSGPASVPAEHAGVIVTEHGVTDLRGLAPAERARSLIRIAHPDHRADLERSLGRRPEPAEAHP